MRVANEKAQLPDMSGIESLSKNLLANCTKKLQQNEPKQQNLSFSSFAIFAIFAVFPTFLDEFCGNLLSSFFC